MNIASIKDLHFRFGFPHPRGRTDEFENQIWQKLHFVRDTLLDLNINILVLTGDSLDIKAPNQYSLHHLKANVNAFKFLAKHFTIYDIAGNHSLPYSSTDHKHESVHQFLIDHNIILDASVGWHELQSNRFLYGVDFTPDMNELLATMKAHDVRLERGIKSGDFPQDSKLIAVVHEHLVPTDEDKEHFGLSLTYHQVTKDLKCHGVILAGHLHKGFPVGKCNGITIVNSWNFTRLGRGYYTINGDHIPQIAITNLDTLESYYINIPHESFESAFITADLERESNLQMDISDFIHKADISQASNTIDNVPAHLQAMINDYLERAQLTT